MIIKTNDQYRACLAEVDRLAADDPPSGTPDGDRLELLAKLVEDYEKGRFRFKRPAPIEAIRFRMEEQGLRQKDLAHLKRCLWWIAFRVCDPIESLINRVFRRKP